jgi:hypothetical protein
MNAATPLDAFTEHYAQLVEADEKDRRDRFVRAWASYQGEAPKPLRLTPDGFDDNVRINYARLVVDKGVSFLGVPTAQIDADTSKRSATEDYASEVWKNSGGPLGFSRLAVNGGVCGHTFAKIIPAEPTPRVVVLDPQNVTMKWRADDHEAVYEFRITWTEWDAERRKMIGRRQRHVENEGGESWEVIEERSPEVGDRWVEFSRETWRYPFSQIVHGQNLPAPNQVWGRSDLENDVLDLIEAIEFSVSNVNRILRFQAHGLWYTDAEGGLETLNRSIGRIVRFPKGTKIDKLEMDSDLSSSMEFLRHLRQSLAEVTRVPEVATGKVESIGNLAGVALQILYQPLLELTETKRDTYGEVYSEATRRALIVGGKPDAEVTPSWPEMLPADTQTLIDDQTLGIVSKRTLAEKRGYDYDVEAARIEEEKGSAPGATERALGTMLDAMNGAPADGEPSPAAPFGSPQPIPAPMPGGKNTA